MPTNKLSKAERPFVIDCAIVSAASAIVTLILCAIAPVQPIPTLLLHTVVPAHPSAGTLLSERPIRA
jgi:hypothetical protein